MPTRVLESLVNAFGRAVTPLQLPIGSEKSLSGIVDLVRMKAYTYEMGGNGKGKEGPIPANMADAPRKRTRNWWSWWPRAKMS
jgi:elongation factor G